MATKRDLYIVTNLTQPVIYVLSEIEPELYLQLIIGEAVTRRIFATFNSSSTCISHQKRQGLKQLYEAAIKCLRSDQTKVLYY